MARDAARLVIQGRVQGVGYRWWIVQVATDLGLAGWVRNRADGSVEVLAIGVADAVQRLIGLCGGGSTGAVVRSVHVEAASDDGSAGFEQKATV